MADWENLRYFLALGRAGTLSGAARALKVDHATVSRRIAALEIELQMPLVERLPRACRLTAAGLRVFEQVKSMEGAAFAIDRESHAQQTMQHGRVKISASPVLTSHFLAPRMAAFRALHPNIQLSVMSQARQVSLNRGEADIALRQARPTEASNVARRIGRMPFALYASRDYVALATPEHWRFIVYDEQFADMPQQHWLLGVANGRPVACELSDISSHLIAAYTGAGVAGLPCFLGDAHGGLVKLESGESAFSRDIWLVTHRDLKRSSLVRAVMNYLAEAVADTPGLALQ
jgi:DNA-binding transcriptional LysR family regulator